MALALSDRDGWNRPSQYTTIQTADLNGDGEYELLARAADGVHVYRWNAGANTFTDISKPPRLFSDAAGGADPSVYETIQTGRSARQRTRLDPRANLSRHRVRPLERAERPLRGCDADRDRFRSGRPDRRSESSCRARGSCRRELAGGVRWYVFRADGAIREEPTLHFADLDGFNRPSQYETVRAIHVPGMRWDTVIARDRTGLHFYSHDTGNGAWVTNAPPLHDLSDANGFDRPSQYRTIWAGDATGSGKLDVVDRTSTGITTWELRQTESGVSHWVKLSDSPALTGAGVGPGQPLRHDPPWRHQRRRPLRAHRPRGVRRADLHLARRSVSPASALRRLSGLLRR